MPDVTIVYWRDIPAQVIVGPGPAGHQGALSERFEQAIDRAAMKVGAREPTPTSPNGARPRPIRGGRAGRGGAGRGGADRADYDAARLKALIDNHGRA
jgi:hypothetical protein